MNTDPDVVNGLKEDILVHGVALLCEREIFAEVLHDLYDDRPRQEIIKLLGNVGYTKKDQKYVISGEFDKKSVAIGVALDEDSDDIVTEFLGLFSGPLDFLLIINFLRAKDPVNEVWEVGEGVWMVNLASGPLPSDDTLVFFLYTILMGPSSTRNLLDVLDRYYEMKLTPGQTEKLAAINQCWDDIDFLLAPDYESLYAFKEKSPFDEDFPLVLALYLKTGDVN